MKRNFVVLILMALIMALVLSACGSKEESSFSSLNKRSKSASSVANSTILDSSTTAQPSYSSLEVQNSSRSSSSAQEVSNESVSSSLVDSSLESSMENSMQITNSQSQASSTVITSTEVSTSYSSSEDSSSSVKSSSSKDSFSSVKSTSKSSSSSSKSSSISSSSSSLSSSKSSSSSSLEQKYLLTVLYTGAKQNPQTYTKEYKSGEAYSVETPVVEGYTSTNSQVSGVMEESNLTVTVTYTPITYKISYDYNGGVAGQTNPTSAKYDTAFAPSVPTKAGYKFAGWSISGVNTQTALYGNSTSQTEKVYSDLTRCYQLNSTDLDYNDSEYWTGTVYFKNLTTTPNTTVTLKANWTALDKISGANDSASVINTANDTLANSKIIEIANGLEGSFGLSFSYYQNAVIDQTNLKFSNTCWRTGILTIGKYTDWGYITSIRQDGFSWNGTNPIGTVSTPSNYTASNDYGEMFYGLAGNNSSATSTKFANFVRNSLVTYTIEGTKVGQVGGVLKVTQTILSLGAEYKNQSVTIVYDINLTDGILHGAGLDIMVKAEDADLSFESVSYEILSDCYTFTSTDSQTYGTLVDNYSHYCPDKYWTGDFDFTVSYNQSQSNYFSSWADTCWRTGYVVFYEWQNTAEKILFRNDWHGEIASGATKFTFDNSSVKSMGEFASITTGKSTSYGGSQVQELRLFRNASVTIRCVREGNTVCVYQFVSAPGSSEVVLFNAYKFTTTIEKLSLQIVGRTSGITITYEDYGANTKVLANSSLGGTTYGVGTYTFTLNQTRAHMAIPFSVKKGTVIKYKGTTNYRWSVLELSKYLGAYDKAEHSSERLYDTAWIDPSVTTSYTVARDCYIAVNIRYADNTTSFSGVDILALMKQCFEITFTLDNNINTNEQAFTSSMLKDNTTYGLTTYSGQFGEGNPRCHIAVIPLIKKGTVITFKGGTTYRWSVLEMASERIILHDTSWMDPASVTKYMVTRDCYIAVNVKFANEATMDGVDIYSLLYNNITIEGKCGVVVCENPITHSATEEGDMQSINHRGFSATAPENTMAAYSVSKYKGFTKVECDINFTKDGYGVLLHDGSIDRTSDGTGNIGGINFNTVRGYDFGTWKSATYANEQMPTVEEFLLQCKNLQLHPYLELKYGTKAQIQRLAMLVRRLGMEDNVTWISFDLNCLTYVRDVSPGARLGFLHSDITQTVINSANTLKTGRNEVFLDINYGCVDTASEASSRVALCKANNLPLEVWTVNDEQTMKNVYTATGGYVTGFTSDNTIAEKVNFG